MDIEYIVSELGRLGNQHQSYFEGTVFFYLEQYNAHKTFSDNTRITVKICFPLQQSNPIGDMPNSNLTLFYEGDFSPAHTDDSIVDIIYNYAIEYAKHYVKPIINIIPTLNRGKFFNKPKGWQG